MRNFVRRTVSIALTTVVLLALTLGIAAPSVAAQDAESASAEVTVAEDGSVESMETATGVSTANYEEFVAIAEQEGYDRLDDWYESLYEQESWVGSVSATTVEASGGYVIALEATDIDPSTVPEVDVMVDEDTISYEETGVVNPANDQQITEATHQVTMPSEITDSNADEVADNVATWNLHEEHTSELFVEASLEDGAAVVDETNDEDDGSGDSEEDGDGIEPEDEDEVDEDPDATGESADTENDSDDGSDTDDGNDSDDESESSSADDTDDENDGMPGFGGTVALAALCIATVLALGRQTST